jgi:hypothetical protein
VRYPGRRQAIHPDSTEEAWCRDKIERTWRILEVVGEIAEARGKTYAQIAPNWLLSRPEVSSVIVGARTPEQLAQNLGAAGWALSEEELQRPNAASAAELGYPYGMTQHSAPCSQARALRPPTSGGSSESFEEPLGRSASDQLDHVSGQRRSHDSRA